MCVRPGIQSEDQNQFFTFKVRTFWQSEVKMSVLALWLGALSSLFHNMGVGGMDVILSLYVPGMFRGVWKKCLHFECVIHRFVLALNAGTNTLYTRVYIVSSLWMPGQVGVYSRVFCIHFDQYLKNHVAYWNVNAIMKFLRQLTSWCIYHFHNSVANFEIVHETCLVLVCQICDETIFSKQTSHRGWEVINKDEKQYTAKKKKWTNRHPYQLLEKGKPTTLDTLFC